MKITEADLGPLRVEKRLQAGKGSPSVFSNAMKAGNELLVRDLPSSTFSPTMDLFFPEWDSIERSGWTLEEDRAAISVVPVLAFLGVLPPLPEDREWIGIKHQCGGYSCRQSRMVGTVLTPVVAMKEKLDHVGKQFYYAENGYLTGNDLLASTICEYVAALGAIGVDCECTWSWLREGHYPIDCTLENFQKIATDKPWPDLLADRHRYTDTPMLLLLAENSD